MASSKALATSLLLTFNLLLPFIMVCSSAPTPAPNSPTSPSPAPSTVAPRAPTRPPAPAPSTVAPRALTRPPAPAPAPTQIAPKSPPPTPTPAPKAPTSPPVPMPSPPPPPSPQGSCSMDIHKLGVCANLLGGFVNIGLGQPPTRPCCSLIDGLADVEVGVCLCTAIRANVLGINLNLPVALSLILNKCGRSSSSYQCAIN